MKFSVKQPKMPSAKLPTVKIKTSGIGLPKRPRVFGAKRSNFKGDSYYNRIFK